MLIQGIAGT
jgi:hypothetical protein